MLKWEWTLPPSRNVASVASGACVKDNIFLDGFLIGEI